MHRSEVTVDLRTLADNIFALRRALRPDCEPIFVVKSDAYGHGLKPMAKRAAQAGIRWFAVAYLHEALPLRQVCPEADILILGPIEADDVEEVVAGNLTPVIVSRRHGEALSARADECGVPINCHLKIDSGMGRFGLRGGNLPTDIRALIDLPGLNVTGICSHFATVEDRQPELASGQVSVFMQAVDLAESTTGGRLMRHISSSRAVQFHEEWDLDAIRPGILLYGYGSTSDMRVQTHPILEWKARLMQVKEVPEDFSVGYYAAYRTLTETKIGTLSVGYADGFLRSLSNRGWVLAGGERAQVVGRISMNWVTVDLGRGSDAREGDEVVLIGRQGDDAIWADEVGRWAGTIAYETLCAIHASVPRRYIEG